MPKTMREKPVSGFRKRLVDTLGAKPGKKISVPTKIHVFMNVDRNTIGRAIKDLNAVGYKFVRSRKSTEVGSHTTDRSLLKRSEAMVLDACTWNPKKKVMVRPVNLHKKLGMNSSTVVEAVSKLKKVGYKFEFDTPSGKQPSGIEKTITANKIPYEDRVTFLRRVYANPVKSRLGQQQKKIIESCKIVNNTYILPYDVEGETGINKRGQSKILKRLERRGFVFVRHGQFGTHLKDGSGLTENQQRVLNACTYKNGELIVPEKLHENMGLRTGRIWDVVRQLKDRGYKFGKNTNKLTEWQEEFLSHCELKNKVYWIPGSIRDKVGPQKKKNVSNTVITLRKKGYALKYKGR